MSNTNYKQHRSSSLQPTFGTPLIQYDNLYLPLLQYGLAGVAREVNLEEQTLRSSLLNNVVHSGFEIQRRPREVYIKNCI